MKKILITGGSGLIGRRITQQLQSHGHEVVWLSTRKSLNSPVQTYFWDPSHHFVEETAFDGVTDIINLAGEPLAQKWTIQSKQRMYNSRIDAIKTIYQGLERLAVKPNTFVSASAVGYYPSHESKAYVETDLPGEDFLSQITIAWENESASIAQLGLREVRLRIGIVLDPSGGALKEFLPTVKFGIGSPLGTGKQWMPWIHIDDLASMFVYAIENDELRGPYNACSPNPVTNKTMVKTIGKVLHRPVFLPPVPGFLLKLILGEMSEIVLTSTKVIPKKIVDTGFIYQFPELFPALENLLKDS